MDQEYKNGLSERIKHSRQLATREMAKAWQYREIIHCCQAADAAEELALQAESCIDMKDRPTFDPRYVRKNWIAPLIGEEHLRTFLCPRGNRVWFISKIGLALLVSRRKLPQAACCFGFAGCQALGRMAEWAEGY